MTNNRSLRTKLKDDLTTSLSVSIVAVVYAILAFFIFTEISDTTTGGFLLAINIAVFIPYAYEQYWPMKYATGATIIWTTSAALITTGLFIGAYQLTSFVTTGNFALGVAFVLTVIIQYGIAALFARTRQRA